MVGPMPVCPSDIQAMDAGEYNYAIAFQERIKISDEKMEFYKVMKTTDFLVSLIKLSSGDMLLFWHGLRVVRVFGRIYARDGFVCCAPDIELLTRGQILSRTSSTRD